MSVDLKIYTVCFFGHREIENFRFAEEKVYEIVSSLIRTKEYVDFIVGRNGEFDQIVSSCVIRAKKNIFDANSSLVLILPYPTADYLNNVEYYEQYYNEIEIANNSETHFKTAFQRRNRQMVEKSDLCIFYVEHKSGGAYQTMKYAKSIGKSIVNICNFT